MTDEFDPNDSTPFDSDVDLTADEMSDLFGDGSEGPDDGEAEDPDPELSPACSFGDD